MLILNRRPGEKLFIDDDRIQVTVLKTGPNTVKLGVDAPKHVTIYRNEFWDKKNKSTSADQLTWHSSQ